MRKLIYSFVIVFLLISTSAYAQDKLKEEVNKSMTGEKAKAKNLKQGEVAPFPGHLLNKRALSDMVVRIKFGRQLCDLEKSHELDKLKLKLKEQTEQSKNTIDSLTKLNTDITAIQNKHIVELSKIVTTTKKGFFERMKDSSFWTGLTVGIITGVVLSVGSYYAFNK